MLHNYNILIFLQGTDVALKDDNVVSSYFLLFAKGREILYYLR